MERFVYEVHLDNGNTAFQTRSGGILAMVRPGEDIGRARQQIWDMGYGLAPGAQDSLEHGGSGAVEAAEVQAAIDSIMSH